MTELEYHEEVPYAVMWGDFLAARFSILENAERYAENTVGKVIDTTPKPKIPEGAEFIMWGAPSCPEFASLLEVNGKGHKIWSVRNYRYDQQELGDYIGDAEVTVLVRLGEAHGGDSRPQEES